MPLRGIPRCLTPDLLKILAEMGHGDEIVIADANFPATAMCQDRQRVVHLQGVSGKKALKAILKLLPLDQYVECPAVVMERVPADEAKGLQVPIWKDYQVLLNAAEKKEIQIEKEERFRFYERAKRAFAIVATGESAQYANIILKKGVLVPKMTRKKSETDAKEA